MTGGRTPLDLLTAGIVEQRRLGCPSFALALERAAGGMRWPSGRVRNDTLDLVDAALGEWEFAYAGMPTRASTAIRRVSTV